LHQSNSTTEDGVPRISRIAGAVVLAVSVAATTVSNAQNFTVDRWNIGGEDGTDYLTAQTGTGRVFVSRGTRVMVVDGLTGGLLGEVVDTPRVHGIAIAPKSNHGFTTNGGDSTVTMFDLKTLAVIKKIKVPNGGLDSIMFDEYDDKVILTNHSRPTGTLVAIDPDNGDIVGTAELEDTAPEGAAPNGKGWLYVTNEKKNTIQIVDVRTWKAIRSWPVAPCESPTGIAYDRSSDRIFVGCGKTSVVVDGTSGKVVATIKNGDRVDALGWDPSQRLIYIPGGTPGNVTVVHQDSPNNYTVVATVPTMFGAKTIAVDPVANRAYLFQPEYGPTPVPDSGVVAPSPGRRNGPRGPVIGAWFFAIHQ
jgi:DNA-binding beta-propeller fold protein YncE